MAAGDVTLPDIMPIHAPGVEALDTPHLDPEITRATLSDIARANALFGGRSAVAWGVDGLLHGTGAQVLTLLDVGAGMGDVAGWLERHGLGRGTELRAFALDRHLEAARVDIVVASQLLHHFGSAAAVRLARELTRVARVGVVVGDLRRSRIAAAGIWLAAVALRFHRVSRQDGVTSVRRGYSERELTELLRHAGVAATVTARPGYRLVATWRTGDANG
jgi:hypothetical protein